AKALAGARRIYLVGQRSLFPAAFYVHYACSMFRDDLILLDGSGGTFADGLRGISEEDAILVFSFEPYSRGTIDAARYAADHGATMVAVTDSPAMFRSVVPAMTISQVLVAQILAQGGQEALSRVTESEDQLESFGTYWTEVDRVHTDAFLWNRTRRDMTMPVHLQI
ncbi:MAG: SIS domain-containing protein, partial [Alphaproteobacteria bacterium]|nr:SIS domain-containing protein [Alphaproteobacteria bacterium]